ncbi:MAG: hypothetical protein ACX93U_24360 [Salipiger thiooxidans]|uniref:hypothetical protein n=1 Tax=Salipiger thiooxidans TaxID=282683 RepID=UPI001CF97A66|nr:hypothetical protein [Salipiger thiooxidans]
MSEAKPITIMQWCMLVAFSESDEPLTSESATQGMWRVLEEVVRGTRPVPDDVIFGEVA